MAGAPLGDGRHRVFLALPLADLFEKELAAGIEDLKRLYDGVKWARPEQVHVTLHFFGWLDGVAVQKVIPAVREEIRGFTPLCLGLEDCGAFPNLHSPRVLWIGLYGDVDALVRLQQALENRLRREGFPIENRPFKPHLTVGRGRKGQKIRALAPQPAPAFKRTEARRCERVVLYESHLSPSGPRYEIIQTFPLS